MEKPDQATIQAMFNRLARRYDVFNLLTSLGLDTVWRSKTLACLKPGMRVLDLGCGTGDSSLEALKRVGKTGYVAGLDFSPAMLEIAKNRHAHNPKTSHLPCQWTLRRCEEIPFENEPYDVIVSGFVLRNIYQSIHEVLRGAYQSLKVGGKISFVDITEPSHPWVKSLWTLYMTTLVALYGKILFGKDCPMFYLTQSAARFLKPPDFVQKLKDSGFKNPSATPMLFGIITLYQAEK